MEITCTDRNVCIFIETKYLILNNYARAYIQMCVIDHTHMGVTLAIFMHNLHIPYANMIRIKADLHLLETMKENSTANVNVR